jgi:phosphoribosylanthranilate isomerase
MMTSHRKTPQLPQLKVCGITNLPDARAALKAGADWLGLIAVPGTPRCMEMAHARSLVEELHEEYPHAYVVGVFQNTGLAEVAQYARTVGLNAIQLHGEENPADFEVLDLPLIKVLKLQADLQMAALQAQAVEALQVPQVRAVLLDLPKGGGLKSILDWPSFHRLPELIEDMPCWVAGGLNPDNLETVLQALCPYHLAGVDVASGVERAPGRKDPARLQQFGDLVKTYQSTSVRNHEIRPFEVSQINFSQTKSGD